jgi:energy-coupling factor transporter ATP-binding protein EcfA2
MDPLAPSVLFRGPNFSGRSARLHAINEAAGERGFFIEPDIIGSFSGVSPTLNTELDYFSSSLQAKKRAHDFIQSLSMGTILSRNPLSLSGGEQAVAALGLAIGHGSERIAADCCFEQLDRQLRPIIVDCFSAHSQGQIAYADNRADEHDTPACDGSVVLPATGETFAASLDHRFISDRPIESNAIVIRDLTASYDSNDEFILSVPYLELEPGRIYHLVGQNGSGKTTLCRVLVGLLKKTQGSIVSGGRETNTWARPAGIVSLAFQNPDDQLCMNKVGAELVARGCPKNEVVSMIKALGLPVSLDSHPGSLPFVLRKRLSLAATFCLPRGWYILDEPTLGQDNESIAEIALILERMAARGAGIIVVSHSERFAQHLKAVGILLTGGICAELGDRREQYGRG